MAMHLRKREYQRRNIRKIVRESGVPKGTLDSQSGQTGWAMGLFSLLFLVVVLCALLKMELFRTIALYMEDALAASNLASAVVDLKEYGKTHKILIGDIHAAYERYIKAIKGNLNLNDTWEGQEGGVVQGTVRVVNYTIYNVEEDLVTVYYYDENGLMTSWNEPLGSATAPNGKCIESTSVYSEIAFPTKVFMGIEIEAHKGKLADITK